MDESNIGLEQNSKDDFEKKEIPQSLSSELVNGILNRMKSQFNSDDNIDVQEEQRVLTENEESVRRPKSIKRKRKGTAATAILTVNTKMPSKNGGPEPPSEDGDETNLENKLDIEEIRTNVENPAQITKSNRRRSNREFSESVVQNAIARKEKLFTQISSEHVRRPTRPLKPTQKVLDNLAAASQKRGSKAKAKFSEYSEIDYKKVPKKSQRFPKNGKKNKVEETDYESVNSDNEHLINLRKSISEKYEVETIQTRRSQRISSVSSFSKKDEETPNIFSEKSNTSIVKSPTEHLSVSDHLIESHVCLCTKTTEIFVEKDKDTVYCEALDNIDGKIIGCSRTLNSKHVRAIRASLRVPYSLYCEMHTERLKVHNCCPTCGIFCTQGRFSECSNKHQYHYDCHLLIGEKVCCPHCGLSSSNKNVELKLECHQNIISNNIYIPRQRPKISSDKPSAAGRNTSNFCHAINDSTYPTNSPVAKIRITAENRLIDSSDIPVALCVNKMNDIPLKLCKLMLKMSNGSSSDAVNPKKTTARHKNSREVSSVTNLIPIQNLEQQFDDSKDGEDDFERSIDLHTISDLILNEKYGQLCSLLDTASTIRPIDLSFPFTYPAHLAPFLCISSSTSTPPSVLGTVLHYACALGRTVAVRTIIQSPQLGGVDDLRRLLLLMDSDQNTPLAVALANGKNECANLLLETGVSSITVKGADGMSPLHICARAGNLTGCDLLFSQISTISNIHRYVNTTDDGGWTALVWASEHAHADVVALLLARGADRMRRDVERNVAAHWACYAGHVAVLNVLLDVDGVGKRIWLLEMVNAVNIQGDTPLHLAAHQGHVACVTQLLVHGADPSLRNKMHETPLDLVSDVESEAYRSIVSYLHQCSITSISDDFPGKPTIGEGRTCEDHAKVSINGGNLKNRRPMKQMLLNNDISRGREINPIQLINCIDVTSEPRDYTYITSCCLTTDNVQIDMRITSLRHCDCSAMDIVSCLNQNDDGQSKTSPRRCSCLDGTEIWYDVDGRLVNGFNFQDPPSIFECNDLCGCNSLTCGNRVVQKIGSLINCSIRTQVFRTKNRGWALRTLRNISQGSYVCEYVGEVLTDKDVNLRTDDSYVFDLDSTDSQLYCIDAKFYGNMSRFINHSCRPNLVPVKVFTNHQDLRFPRIAFFANQNIVANDELSFDYGDKFWIIKYKAFTCECGTSECKYSKDKISATLEQYCKTTLPLAVTCNGR